MQRMDMDRMFDNHPMMLGGGMNHHNGGSRHVQFEEEEGERRHSHGDRERRHHHRTGRSSSNRNQVSQHQHSGHGHRGGGMMMDPFAHFNSMFSNMHSMMSDMRSAFDEGGSSSNSGGHSFQQSSFMSYSNTGDGAPKIVHKTSSSQQGPDGVRETKKTLRDSEAGIDQIAVGHHIRDRGHVVERTRKNRTGDMDHNEEYINLDEEEAEAFNREYQERWQSSMRGIEQRRPHTDRAGRSPVGDTRHLAAAALSQPEGKQRRQRKTSHRKQ